MVVGAYPFEDPEEPKNFRKTIQVILFLFFPLSCFRSFKLKTNTMTSPLQRILSVQYSIPDNVDISPECRHLISRIFVGDPALVSPRRFHSRN